MSDTNQPQQPKVIFPEKRQWVIDGIRLGFADEFLDRWMKEIMDTPMAHAKLMEGLALLVHNEPPAPPPAI